MRTTHVFTLLVDATNADEADAIVTNMLSGKTFGHEVNAHAWQKYIDPDAEVVGLLEDIGSSPLFAEVVGPILVDERQR